MVTSTPCLLFYCTVFCWAFKHETCLLLSPQWSNLHAPPLCFVGAYTQWMFASQYHVRILLKWTHHHFLTKSSWCCVPITPLLRLWIFWTSSSTLLWTSTCTPTSFLEKLSMRVTNYFVSLKDIVLMGQHIQMHNLQRLSCLQLVHMKDIFDDNPFELAFH